MTQPSAGTLVVRVAPGALGLQPGALRWSVVATPASCGVRVRRADRRRDARTRGHGGGARRPTPPPQAPCRSRAPRGTGTYAGRVWRAVVTGCTRHGAGQVSRGPRRKEVALTYDDGPSPYTRPLLATLDRLGVPATFFMIGQQVPGQGALLRRMLEQRPRAGEPQLEPREPRRRRPGRLLAAGAHERGDPHARRASRRASSARRTAAPSGDLVARANALGMTSVIWSADPLDWRTPGTGAIVVARPQPDRPRRHHPRARRRREPLAVARRRAADHRRPAGARLPLRDGQPAARLRRAHHAAALSAGQRDGARSRRRGTCGRPLDATRAARTYVATSSFGTTKMRRFCR